MFHPISKHRKNEAQPSFLNHLRGVWELDGTLFQLFDIASQTIYNSWRNPKQSSRNFMIIKITLPNLLHDSDKLPLFSLHGLLISLRSRFSVGLTSACLCHLKVMILELFWSQTGVFLLAHFFPRLLLIPQQFMHPRRPRGS